MEPEPHGKRQGRIDPSPKEKTPAGGQTLLTLISKVAQLEGTVESLLTVVHSLNQYREIADSNTNELRSKLKETIRAVERLAKGKSIGCLGLPTEESWTSTN